MSMLLLRFALLIKMLVSNSYHSNRSRLTNLKVCRLKLNMIILLYMKTDNDGAILVIVLL